MVPHSLLCQIVAANLCILYVHPGIARVIPQQHKHGSLPQMCGLPLKMKMNQRVNGMKYPSVLVSLHSTTWVSASPVSLCHLSGATSSLKTNIIQPQASSKYTCPYGLLHSTIQWSCGLKSQKIRWQASYELSWVLMNWDPNKLLPSLPFPKSKPSRICLPKRN